MALNFPTTGDYVQASAAASINNLTLGTVVCSAYPTSTATTMCLYEKSGAQTGQLLRVSTVWDFVLGRDGVSNPISVETTAVVTANAWNDYAIVWNRTSIVATDQRAYVGSPTVPFAEASYSYRDAGTGTPVPNDDSTYPIRIGLRNNGTAPWLNGGIGFLQVYNRQLSLAELQAVQASRGRVRLSGLVAWWELGVDGGAGAQPDRSGNGNTASATGSPVVYAHRPGGARNRTVAQSFASAAPAAATALHVATQPAGAVTGVAFTTQPAVQVRDQYGGNFSVAGTIVTAAISTGSGVLSGTTTATTNASGLATFTNLAITGTGAHTLQFTAPGLSNATSSSFTVSAAGSGGGRKPRTARRRRLLGGNA